jgi:hypothetical protein
MSGTINVAPPESGFGFPAERAQFNVPGGQDLIEIANLGDAGGNLGRYRISVANGTAVELPLNDILVPPGGRVVIHANASGANTSTDVYLPTMPDLPTTGSAALYVPNTRNTNLADATQIIDFVQWGAGGQANEATAVAASLWVGDAIIGVDGALDGVLRRERRLRRANWSESRRRTSARTELRDADGSYDLGRLKTLYR